MVGFPKIVKILKTKRSIPTANSIYIIFQNELKYKISQNKCGSKSLKRQTLIQTEVTTIIKSWGTLSLKEQWAFYLL